MCKNCGDEYYAPSRFIKKKGKGLFCCRKCAKIGENNNFYGKKHSEETKKRMSDAVKGLYGGKNNPWYGKKHSEETKKKMSEIKNGKNNPNWNSGLALNEWNDFQVYQNNVYLLTERVKKKFGLKRKKDYEWDHRYSIFEGFKESIPEMILSHPHNLQLITKRENCKKSTKCSITVDELYVGYRESDMESLL